MKITKSYKNTQLHVNTQKY